MQSRYDWLLRVHPTVHEQNNENEIHNWSECEQDNFASYWTVYVTDPMLSDEQLNKRMGC